MNQIEVRIMGQSYLLASPDDGEDALREAVARVDAAMCSIRDAGKVKARERIAVLAALNLAYDLIQRESAPAPTPAPTAMADGDPERAAHLIRRLDQALSGDGLLL